jgi:hypothetical protein
MQPRQQGQLVGGIVRGFDLIVSFVIMIFIVIVVIGIVIVIAGVVIMVVVRFVITIAISFDSLGCLLEAVGSDSSKSWCII